MSDTVNIIAISGKSGCGNTSVSKLVAQKLGFSCLNYTLRNLANELSMPLNELLEKAKYDYSFDHLLDTKQKELAHQSNSVIGSRLAIWLFPEAVLRVYLYADLETRAKRIHQREKTSDYETIKNETHNRDSNDYERFKRIYNIDNNHYEFVDLIINTMYYTPEAIADIITNAYNIAVLEKFGGKDAERT